MKFVQYLKNTTAVSIATLISVALSFLTQIVLARMLSPSEFGDFITIIATVTVFSTFSSFGADLSLLKYFGISNSVGNNFGYMALKFTILSSICSVMLMVTFSFLTNPERTVYFVMLIPCVISYAAWNLSNIVLQVQAKYLKLAVFQISQASIRLLVLLVCYFVSGFFVVEMITTVYFVYSLAGILLFFSTFKTCQLLHQKKVTRVEEGCIYDAQYSLKDILLASWPFGVAAMMHSLYFQNGILIINAKVGSSESAMFAIALSFLAAVYIIPGVIYQKIILPKYHLWSNHDESLLLKIYQNGNGIMLVAGLFIASLIWFTAPILIAVFFGDRYSDAINILKILAFTIPLRFLISNCGALLSTKDLVNSKIKAMAFVVVFNILLNLILSNEFGSYGVLYSLLLSELMMLSLFLALIHFKVFGFKLWKNWFNFKGLF